MLLITQNARLRKKLQNVIWMLLLQISLIFGQELNRPLRVLIDPGHGGMDSGAVGVTGIQEKEVVLNLALALQHLNATLGHPLDLFFTRSSDTLISLSDRSKLARSLQADVFLSLHCNHSDNPKARGVEVYVYDKPNSNTEPATWLAFQIQEDFYKKLGFKSRGVKFDNFQVLRETSGLMPSLLLELGFMSNRDENMYFLLTEFLSSVAILILECLLKNLDCY
ncbi:N-acetylmuramoyl-L-alanine amidase [Leeuwenhoekiella polynyae]|uniref:N-acetylmuramoyl-L-alanine amidase n=1 Tax=Leeuwenhoekiella polynyae TaxID=1550906 RepID=A0A4Q0P0R6_9FLAO|nr:N-acetylmuramoyl-L-alanine amidase [Leeuwenhoekiella polynyae]RXG20054.1 N-acetylmuramoyl-L-alanine amidase [Leeuwenhoekiella polynyae]